MGLSTCFLTVTQLFWAGNKACCGLHLTHGHTFCLLFDLCRHEPSQLTHADARVQEDVTHAEVAIAAEGVASYHADAIQIPLDALNLIRPEVPLAVPA